jgi:uncharacterized membrane protein
MTRSEQTAAHRQAQVRPTPRLDMEILIGSLLLGGVLVSMGLLVAGLTWHWVRTGRLELDYRIVGMNLFQFVLANLREVASAAVRPRSLMNLGLAVLMLTPYVRVLVCMFYFAAVERNWKYTVFTGFVGLVLTYSLFLR